MQVALRFQIYMFYYFAITVSQCWRPYVVQFTNISSASHVNFLQMNSSISDSGSISVYMNFLQDVYNVHAKVLIRLQTSDQVYDLEFANKTINVCEFFRNQRYERILQLFYKVLNRNRSFPSSCPIRKNYFIENVSVNTEDLPPLLPSSKNKAEIYLMSKTGNQAHKQGTKIYCAKWLAETIQRKNVKLANESNILATGKINLLAEKMPFYSQQ